MNEPGEQQQLGRFLTIADTAMELNVSVSQVYTLVHSGELPAIQIGSRRQWRIERSILEGYIVAKYEETRRRNLWNQADYSGLLEFEPSRE